MAFGQIIRKFVPTHIWNYVLVTIVTLLIWFWAASETLQIQNITVSVKLVPPPQPALYVRSDTTSLTLQIEGSAQAVEDIKMGLGNTLELPFATLGLPAETGTSTLDLLPLLRDQDIFRTSGDRLLDCKPPTTQVRVDELVNINVKIQPRVTGIDFETIRFSPPDATLVMPERLRRATRTLPTVYAALDADALRQLSTGIEHTAQRIPLRPPDNLADEAGVSITPEYVDATFTIRSQIRETTLDVVLVQLFGPAADADDYVVRLDPGQLRDVTIRADVDIIRQIEDDRLQVIAMIHLSSREKEIGVDSKPVTGFVALPRDPERRQDLVLVDAVAADGDPLLPEIGLDIRERETTPP